KLSRSARRKNGPHASPGRMSRHYRRKGPRAALAPLPEAPIMPLMSSRPIRWGPGPGGRPVGAGPDPPRHPTHGDGGRRVVRSPRMTPEDLVELEAIKRLKYAYARCLDLKLWDEIAGLFTEDAVAAYSGGGYTFEGREAIVDFLTRSMGSETFH